MLRIKSKQWLNPFTNKQLFGFTVYTNQLFSPFEIIDGQRVNYDNNIEQYEPIIQAYLQKRRTQKHEIAAKMHILAPLKGIEGILKTQKLIKMTKMLSLDELKLYKTTEQIDSKYLMSVVCENYYKELIDEYLSKILINGAVPPLNELNRYKAIKQKIMSFYKTFFYGDTISDLENDIEMIYLENKERKWKTYLKNKRIRFKCLWTFANQRCFLNFRNQLQKDPNLFDEFRPLHKKLNLEEKQKNIDSIMQINSDSWFKKFLASLMVWPALNRSKSRASKISAMLFGRIVQYTESLEFLQMLSIPDDFQIKYGIFNMHVWLIMNRLREINTGESNFLAKDIELKFMNFLNLNASRIHLRKRNDFVKDLKHYLLNSRNHFFLHLNKNEKTKDNHFHKIDALIWSAIFFEKVPRYADEVYFLSDYFLKHHKSISRMSFKQLENSDFEWDIYRIQMNYKEEIEKVNPPLSQDEFLKEKEGKNKIKKYYYSFDEEPK